MNQIQNAKLSMTRVVVAFADKNATVVASHPAFGDACVELKALLSKLQANTSATKTDTKSVTKEKNSEKVKLAKLMMTVAGPISSYATKTNNIVLKGSVPTSEKTLKRMANNQLPLVCDNLLQTATGILVKMPGFGLTQAKIDALATANDTYSDSVPEVRGSIGTRHTKTELVKMNISEIMTLLDDRMDPLMPAIEETDPEFVAAYRSSRVVIYPHKKKKKAKKQVQEQIAQQETAPVAEVPATHDVDTPEMAVTPGLTGETEVAEAPAEATKAA